MSKTKWKKAYANLDVDYYTPIQPFEWQGKKYPGIQWLLDTLDREYGGHKQVANVCRISSRQWRRIRLGEGHNPNVAISMMVLDKILTRTGRPHLIEQLPWFLVEDLIEMGLWKPRNTSGLVQNQRARDK